MAARTGKRNAARLDREIAHALARRREIPSARRHHATAQQEGDAPDDWDVAMDALLEHNVPRAAEMVRRLKREHGVASMTPAFGTALDSVPEAVRRKFEDAAAVVGKKNYDWSTFADGATGAFWADKYASEVENLESDEARSALGPGPGGDWMDVVPDPPRAARALGKRFAKAVRENLSHGELNAVAEKFSAEDAGHYGAMQSLGHGVGWFDRRVDVRPPRGFEYDVDLDNAIWKAIQQKAKEEDVELED